MTRAIPITEADVARERANATRVRDNSEQGARNRRKQARFRARHGVKQLDRKRGVSLRNARMGLPLRLIGQYAVWSITATKTGEIRYVAGALLSVSPAEAIQAWMRSMRTVKVSRLLSGLPITTARAIARSLNDGSSRIGCSDA